MKIKLMTLALATATSVAMTGMAQAFQATKDAPADAPAKKATKKKQAKLGIGSMAPALKGITWVQGEEVKSLNEKGKLYVIECWATWCKPCIALIPHVNKLHQKFSDKGLVIIGMNVMEEGVEKTQEFVKAQGNIDYRVAYSGGNSGDFSSTWLKASKTVGVPTAFVVRDGKILFKGPASLLSEAKIESMMKPDLDVDALIKKEKAEAARIQKLMAQHMKKQNSPERVKNAKFMAKVQELHKKEDWNALRDFVTTDPFAKGRPMTASIISHTNIQLNDWDGQAQLIKDVDAGNYGKDSKVSRLVGTSFLNTDIVPSEKVKAVAKTLVARYATEGSPDGVAEENKFMENIAQARVLFYAGQQEDSVKLLEKILKSTEKFKDEPGAAPFMKKLNETLNDAKEGKFPPFK